jgi:hypothetical protein
VSISRSSTRISGRCVGSPRAKRGRRPALRSAPRRSADRRLRDSRMENSFSLFQLTSMMRRIPRECHDMMMALRWIRGRVNWVLRCIVTLSPPLRGSLQESMVGSGDQYGARLCVRENRWTVGRKCGKSNSSSRRE